MLGTSIARALQREKACGLAPIGFVDSPPPGMGTDLPGPLLGPLPELAEIMVAQRAEYVIVAYTHIPESDLVGYIRSADRLPASFAVVPRLYELVPVRGPIEVISDIPLVRLRRPAFRSPAWRLKRLIDITASGLAILILSPLLAILALIDRIVDGPKVIFRQERIGIDGKPFELYKFRSLRPADTTESETKWNIKHDDRVSWFGKFLRKSSLDELPQLFNILRGDMSIVGPRPERPHFAAKFEAMYPWYGQRSRVPCGLTGWAQIHGLRATRRSPAGRATTTSTSRTGRCGWTSRSCCGRSRVSPAVPAEPTPTSRLLRRSLVGFLAGAGRAAQPVGHQPDDESDDRSQHHRTGENQLLRRAGRSPGRWRRICTARRLGSVSLEVTTWRLIAVTAATA